MIYTIHSDNLTVSCHSQGAEMVSLQFQNKEWIWQAQYPWKRYAPILFPIVGKLKNNQYSYNNLWFSMPQHGFARDMEWICTKHQNNLIEFELTDNEHTFKMYPFYFSLIVQYQIVQDSLKIQFIVFNPYYKTLPFSIGYHPAFYTKEGIEHYNIQFFPSQNTYHRTLLNEGLLTSYEERLQVIDNTLYLNENMFDKDAIILKNTNINTIILRNQATGESVQISSLCKHWGIWSKCKHFVCIEPWMGIADDTDSTGNILEKESIILLEPYQQWKWNIEIKILH